MTLDKQSTCFPADRRQRGPSCRQETIAHSTAALCAIVSWQQAESGKRKAAIPALAACRSLLKVDSIACQELSTLRLGCKNVVSQPGRRDGFERPQRHDALIFTPACPGSPAEWFRMRGGDASHGVQRHPPHVFMPVLHPCQQGRLRGRKRKVADVQLHGELPLDIRIVGANRIAAGGLRSTLG